MAVGQLTMQKLHSCTAQFDFTTAHIVINCTLKYALLYSFMLYGCGSFVKALFACKMCLVVMLLGPCRFWYSVEQSLMNVKLCYRPIYLFCKLSGQFVSCCFSIALTLKLFNFKNCNCFVFITRSWNWPLWMRSSFNIFVVTILRLDCML